MMIFVFLGAWTQGVLPLCIGTVPMESLAQRNAAASGLIMATGMIGGRAHRTGRMRSSGRSIRSGVAIAICGAAAALAALTCRALGETRRASEEHRC